MKTSSHIINKLANFKHYKPLKTSLEYKDFLNLFSYNHKKMISRLFIKNNTLIILVKHHVAYLELNHDNTKKTIKNLIKNYTLAKPSSNFTQVENIKILTEKNITNNFETKITKKQSFLELSNGKFTNNIQNIFLYEKFENIREAINNARK